MSPLFRKRLAAERKGEIPVATFAVIILGLLLFAVSGCQQVPEAAARLPTGTATAWPTATRQITPLPPAVAEVGPTPTDLPSFALPVASATLPATPSATATMAVSPTATIPVAAASTVTTTPGTAAPTAGPTFTPPAAPTSSPNEHYWFSRPVAQDGVVWTDKYYPYGSTRGGQLRVHHGVEFNVPYNTQILAVGTGTVVVAGADSEVAYGPQTNFYGNLVVIRHDFQQNGQPVFSLYGHLNEVLVNVGQQVGAQEVIGLSGATGVADGPHMHLEVRVGANSYAATRNPLLWLYPFSGRGTIAGRVLWPDGQPVMGAPVSLNRVDGDSPYAGTTTYDGDSVNPDSGWNENFALDDVVAGYYQVIVNTGSEQVKTETWVYPGRTSFVEITLK